MNPKEEIKEPLVVNELNVSEGEESLEELEWNATTDVHGLGESNLSIS